MQLLLPQVTIEVPYLFIQALVFEIMTYPTIGYYGSADKVLWYLYAMFCTQLYFNFFGMLFVSLTPDVTIAAALSSAFYPLLNLFSGFLIPRPVSCSLRKFKFLSETILKAVYLMSKQFTCCRKFRSGGYGCII